MSPNPESGRTQIDVGKPQLFTAWAILVQMGISLSALIPFFVAVMLIGVVGVWFQNSPWAIIITALLLLHLSIVAVAFFLPFQLGNFYITRLVEQFEKPLAAKRRRFIVQLACAPRVRKGFRGDIDNADDIGALRFEDDNLVFEGDSITVKLPLRQMSHVRLGSAGWRGFWLLQSVNIGIRDFPGTTAIEVTERTSWNIRKSRQIMQELYELIELHRQRCG